MTSRKPPTTAEIIDALRRGDEHNALAEHRAVSWSSALLLLRPALRTTAERAEQWLTDAVTAPGSDLVVVDPRAPASIRIAGRPVPPASAWVPLTELGWTPQETANLIIGWDGRPHDTTPGPGQYVMLRSSLEYFRVQARMQATRLAEAEASRTRTKLAEFAKTHGDAVPRVLDALAGLPLLDGEDLEDRVVTVNPYGGQERHGTPGSLTIHVRGPQIRALVDLLTAGAARTTAAPPPAGDTERQPVDFATDTPRWRELADRANKSATFHPADPDVSTTDPDPDDAVPLPCVEIAGAQVYSYLHGETGRLRVSLDLDTTEPWLLLDADRVPLEVVVGGETVYVAD